MKNSQKKSGQTLIEVMVALFVLTTGLLGILSLLAQSLAISKNIGNNTIATYLAAEGIELAKSRIDHDMYQHQAGFGGWGSFGIDPSFPATGDYQLDYNDPCETVPHGVSCSVVPSATGVPLSYDPISGLYSYSAPDPSPFTRIIRANPDFPDNEITIQSIVTWSVGLGTQNVTLEDHFYNWFPN